MPSFHKTSKLIVSILFITVLFGSIGLSNVNYTDQYCEDNETLVTHHYYDNGTDNITTKREFTYPQFGCQNGTAVNPTPALKYGGLNLAVLAVFVFINFAAYMLIKERKGLKALFFLFGLFATFYMLFYVGIIGNEFLASSTISQLYKLSWVLARIWLLITLFTIAYFTILPIWRIYGGGKKNNRDQEYMDLGNR